MVNLVGDSNGFLKPRNAGVSQVVTPTIRGTLITRRKYPVSTIAPVLQEGGKNPNNRESSGELG
jgi:hypothetical protein